MGYPLPSQPDRFGWDSAVSFSPVAAPTLADRRELRLATLAALYVAQGLPWGFVTATLVAYLNAGGLELRSIGDLSVAVMLPWTLKFLWGPVIDRFDGGAMGRRRPWILGAQAAMIITLLSLALVDDAAASLPALAAILCIHNAFVALQDVATDSLAIEVLPPHERGLANGLMSAGHYVGVLAGGAGMTWLLAKSDLTTTLVVQALALTGVMLFPALVRERSGDRLFGLGPRSAAGSRTSPRSWAQLGRAIAQGFATRRTATGAAFALAIFFGQGVLIVGAPGLLFQELGWIMTSYAELATALVFGAIAGALAGGALATAIGRKPVVAGGTVLLGAAWLAFAAVESAWSDPSAVTGFAVATSAVQAAMIAALYGLFMDLSLPRIAASHFVLYMALLNASRTAGSWVAADLVEALGYAGTYALVGALQIACAPMLLALRTDKDDQP